ncbi:MAG TPA: DUF1553 domain-containing protein [Bryobacteraceae bacterium]|nr:DUF1553 domain-containing protein [Bryobacteraceae bacterium]
MSKIWLIRGLAALLAPCIIAQTKGVDFQRDVRPILSDNCFACHGPDANTRMAGLRLDLKDAALESRKSGAAVVPGQLDKSLLYQRITETNPARRMPPEYSHKKLEPKQIAVLKKWIETGAPWTEHWAFKAPVKPKPPSVLNAAWVRTPIDRFVLAQLEKQKLSPAPVADKRTLIRRVALDLTGLPPKPSEVEAFLKDTSPKAYEQMVDHYLASPHYGEHRARYWLDAARYADTHGIHIDNYREIWPYRDWVIDAFNRNVPFDQFSMEQLAGDLLPNPTLDQRIATGFHRCNVTTNEGGAIDDEYYEIYAKDRADTTGAVFLGMTVGCATCHDHKFDPISQRDFYALGAFFRNTPQRAMDGNVADTPPFLFVPNKEDREKWAAMEERVRMTEAQLTDISTAPLDAFDKWLQRREPTFGAKVFDDDAQLFVADTQCLVLEADWVSLGESPVDGRQAIYFSKDEGIDLLNVEKISADKPFTISAHFFYSEKAKRAQTIAHQRDPNDKDRGWVLEVYGRIAMLRLTGDDGRSIDVRSVDINDMQPGKWHQLVVTYDGSRLQAGMKMYINGRRVLTQGRTPQRLEGSITVDRPLVFGKGMDGGAISDLRIFKRELTISEMALVNQWPAIESAFEKSNDKLTVKDVAALRQWYLRTQHEPYRELASKLDALSEEHEKLRQRGAITLVMEERKDDTPHAHILFRGAYDQKRERVEASTPSVLPHMPSGYPRNRLGFARWLFLPENPLTARVTVNRMWQELFGTGLVKTTDDFGSQGEPPSHPELLDWLAIDFRENGWDVKRFYRQVLLSGTYRQSAQTTPAKLAKDPDNRLLSRGPRFRMDAEMVRDYALAASGLLSRKIGGPSVKPYQPEGIWEAVAMPSSNTRFYKPDEGEGLYRRSLYTFWKRSAPPATMEIFNAPTRESCTARRERTNTPLQALATMNDVQFMEAARVLAERSMQASNSFDQQLTALAQSVLARPLTLREAAVVGRAYADFKSHYKENPSDAEKLLKSGQRNYDPSLPAAEYAALTMVANQLFNLDEVLNK